MAAGTKKDPIRDSIVTVQKPSALPASVSIERSGNKYTLKWKRGATRASKAYSAQQVRFRRKIAVGSAAAAWKDWESVSVSATATSAAKEYALSGYYPYTTTKLNAVQAEVRALESSYTEKGAAYKKSNGKYYYKQYVYTYSFSEYQKVLFDLNAPNAPAIGTVTGAATSTTVNYSNTNDTLRPFADMQYQSRLIKDWGMRTPDANNVTWTSGDGYEANTVTAASGSITLSAGASLLQRNASYTRVVRMRARGASGDSGWSYKAAYVHAYPLTMPAGNITSVSIQELTDSYRPTVYFTPKTDATHPAESYKVEYYIGNPTNGSMSVPNGANFIEGVTVSSSPATFTTNRKLAADEALWVRVTQIHGPYSTTGAAKCVKFGGVSAITTNPTVTYDSQVHSLTIATTNPVNSNITTSFVRIYIGYRTSRGVTNLKTIDLPHGETQTTLTLNMTGYYEWQIGVQAGIGNNLWGAIRNMVFRPCRDATNIYAYPPSSVTVTPITGSAGRATVAWKNNAENIAKARIQIATDWSAVPVDLVVDEEVEGTNIQTATVTGLSYNTQYYARVKSIRYGDNKETALSEIAAGSFKMSADAAPVPSLTAYEITSGSEHYINVEWDWDTWAQASKLELYWDADESILPTDGVSGYATIDKEGASGKTSYPIKKNIERGNTYHIRARFVAGDAYTNYSKVEHVELPVTPVAPTSLTAVRGAQPTDEAGKTSVMLTWDNSLWEDADTTEVSYSTAENAWDNLGGANLTTGTLSGVNGRETSTRIAGLQMGQTWYFRVRLIYDSKWYSDYATASLDLTTDPAQPVVSVSDSLISERGKTDIAWTYSCEDGSAQASAAILVTDSSGNEVVTIGYSGTETSFLLYPEAYGLTGNEVYNLSVRTMSAIGRTSEWSASVPLKVVHKPIAAITETSLVEETVDDVTFNALKELPLTVSMTGTESRGIATVYIERAKAYFEPSPDEDQRGGYEGELIALKSINGDGTIEIAASDLRGVLNENAPFRIVAFVTDDISESDPVSIDFIPRWTHQATFPNVTREVDDDKRIVTMTIAESETAVEGDCIDIYRLSADKPELIVEGAQFGESYVDPYPAFGESGGHRFVYRTLNNDITTANNELAWIDIDGSCDADDPTAETDAVIPADRTVIDFDGNRIDLFYNLELSHTWEKDFTETKYLGGSVQGDWNPAVSHKSGVGSVSITLDDKETIDMMRRLAVYPGICHVRTPDGSSFPADIQVSENRGYSTGGKIVSFNLDVTEVDAETLDGMTLAEWEAGNELE